MSSVESSLKKAIKTVKKLQKLYNFLITELIRAEIAQNKDLLGLIDNIINADPTLVSDIKEYIFDTNLSFKKLVFKILGRLTKIDIFKIIRNLPNPVKLFNILRNLRLKHITLIDVIKVINKYVTTQIGDKATTQIGDEATTQIGDEATTQIGGEITLAAVSVAVPIILLIISQILTFILKELERKKENEIKLKELNDDYDRNKKIKDAEAEIHLKNILSNSSATSGGYNYVWFHYCY